MRSQRIWAALISTPLHFSPSSRERKWGLSPPVAYGGCRLSDKHKPSLDDGRYELIEGWHGVCHGQVGYFLLPPTQVNFAHHACAIATKKYYFS